MSLSTSIHLLGQVLRAQESQAAKNRRAGESGSETCLTLKEVTSLVLQQACMIVDAKKPRTNKLEKRLV